MHAVSALRYSQLPKQESTTPQVAADLSKPAPAKLTRMRGVTEVAKEIDDDLQNKGTSRARLTRAWTSMKENLQKAKDAGVNAAKKSFWSKALGVAVGALALGAVISLAVSTGGVAVAAAAVIAGVVFATSVADAGCAYMNLRNAQANAAGQPLPYELPMGSRSIGNLLHKAFTSMGAGPAKAKVMATIGDGVLRMGMSAAASVCTMGASAALDSLERIAPMVGAAVNILQAVVDVKHDRSTSKVYAEGVEGIEEAAEKIDAFLSDAEKGASTEELKKLEEARGILEEAQRKVKDEAAATEALVPRMPATAAGAVTTAVLSVAAFAAFPGYSLDPSLSTKHTGGELGGFSDQRSNGTAARP